MPTQIELMYNVRALLDSGPKVAKVTKITENVQVVHFRFPNFGSDYAKVDVCDGACNCITLNNIMYHNDGEDCYETEGKILLPPQFSYALECRSLRAIKDERS